MTRHLSRNIVIAFVLLLCCAGMTNCGNANSQESSGRSQGKSQNIGTRYVIFVDRSISAGSEQEKLWTEAADKLAYKRLHGGDAIMVFEISELTAERSPVQDITIPPRNGTMERDLEIRRLIAKARTEGLAAIANALEHATAKETRLLDSIDRIPKDGSRTGFVLYLTDALESSPELNLERVQLTEKNTVPLAQSAVLRHHWQRGALSDVTVQFVLDSPALNKPHAINDHRALNNFWKLLLTSLGADLKAFDSVIVS